MPLTKEATVSSKGQVTIPKEIRERLDIEAGTEMELTVEADGSIRVRPKDSPMERLRDIRSRLARHDIDLETMRAESKAAWRTERSDRP